MNPNETVGSSTDSLGAVVRDYLEADQLHKSLLCDPDSFASRIMHRAPWSPRLIAIFVRDGVLYHDRIRVLATVVNQHRRDAGHAWANTSQQEGDAEENVTAA